MAKGNQMRQRYMYVETEITVNEESLIIDELKALMISNKIEAYLPCKKVDQRKLRDVTNKVNAVIRHTETDDVTKTNKLAMAAALWVAKEVGLKKGKRGEKKELWWKRRVESDITNLKRDISKKGQMRRNWRERKEKEELNAKYRMKKKEINLVIEELRQRSIAKKTKVKRYEQSISRFRQNQLFQLITTIR